LTTTAFQIPIVKLANSGLLEKWLLKHHCVLLVVTTVKVNSPVKLKPGLTIVVMLTAADKRFLGEVNRMAANP